MTAGGKKVPGWTLPEQIAWILRQPSSEPVRLQRLIDLVRAEKEQTARVATSLHICGKDRS